MLVFASRDSRGGNAPLDSDNGLQTELGAHVTSAPPNLDGLRCGW